MAAVPWNIIMDGLLDFDPSKGCSHGKTFDEPCVECELVLCREGLAAAEKRAAHYRERIKDLSGGSGETAA